MHTLTPEVKKHLQEFADRITPPASSTATGELTGRQLREQHGISTDGKGQPLVDTQLYIVKAPPAVNHHRRLCKAYEQGGYEAVEAYLEPYKTPQARARELAAAQQLAADGTLGYENAVV